MWQPYPWLKKKKAASPAWWKRDFYLPPRQISHWYPEPWPGVLHGEDFWTCLYLRLPNLSLAPLPLALIIQYWLKNMVRYFLLWEFLWSTRAKFSLIKKGSRCVSTQIWLPNPQIYRLWIRICLWVVNHPLSPTLIIHWATLLCCDITSVFLTPEHDVTVNDDFLSCRNRMRAWFRDCGLCV